MYPDIETAKEELRIAGELNPGPWIKHSLNTGIAARNIAQKVPGLDPEKAYVLGMLHDIGRRDSLYGIVEHVYGGFQYAAGQGWDEVAKICMTHSYPLGSAEFSDEPAGEAEEKIRAYIGECEFDDYDLLIQLCDSLALDFGFCILEKRFIDVARRYGLWENSLDRWNRTFWIKEYFEEKMGCSIYDVLPDIGRTTLLSPPSWQPPQKK